MNTLADFKRKLKVGVKLHTQFHKEFDGRDSEGKVKYKTVDKGIREVSIVQSNSFALKTTKKDGSIQDSWCHFPKAKECRIEGDSIVILEEDGLPVLTYTFVDLGVSRSS